MKKIRLRLYAALVAAIMALGFTATSAYAWTDYLVGTQNGGRVYNDPDSDFYIRIYASNGTNFGNYMSLPNNNWSNWYTNFRDTDSFFVNTMSRCTSPWGYHYYGGDNGTWYRLADDKVVLVLFCEVLNPY